MSKGRLFLQVLVSPGVSQHHSDAEEESSSTDDAIRIGFWITFVTLILVIIAGVMMFIKRRRQVLADAGYPMLSSQQKGAKGFLNVFRKS